MVRLKRNLQLLVLTKEKLNTAVGKINEMFPVPIEREFRIVFLLLLLLSRIKIVL
jgi:hypothetical protein